MGEDKTPLMLMDDIFTYGPDSSWDVDNRGGKIVSIGHSCCVFINNENRFPILCRKRFREQRAGRITLEYRFKINKSAGGFYFGLGDGEKHAFRLITNGGTLCWDSGEKLMPVLEYEEKVIYAVRVIADIDSGKCSLCINGADAGDYPLARGTAALNVFVMSSPTEEQSEILFYYVRLYKNFLVNERFSNCSPGRLPYDWDMAGAYQSEAYVEQQTGYDSGDRNVLLISDGVRAAKATALYKPFERCGGRIVFSFGFIADNPEKKEEGIGFSLMSGEREAVTLRAKEGGILAAEGALRSYNPNVWQRVRITADFNAHKAEITVNNHEFPTADIPAQIDAVDGVMFKTSPYEMSKCRICDVMVYAEPKPAADYPARPVKPETSLKLGMQACFLWREGRGPGWDKIECYPERRPYLGWYEDTLPEKADWEIKWLAEHGISFILPCWYPPDGYSGGPIRCASSYDDYFLARYRDDMKIALDINTVGNIGLKDFKEYLLPYWMENFFTASNYMLVDNKPLIAFLYDMLSGICGGAEGTRELLDYIREECRKAGFDGACIIINEQHRTDIHIENTAKLGFDAMFSYTWGRESHKAGEQIKILDTQQSIGKIKVIPTVSQGYNDLAWNGYTNGGYITPEELRSTLLWVRDDFLKRARTGSGLDDIVLFDNWNEFGEGHFFMPAELCGFEYMDIIRSTFTDDKPHTDTVPTPEQLARIDTMYMPGRRALKRVKAHPGRGGKVICAWHFDNADDAGQWRASDGIENFAAENGALTGEITSPGGYIYLDKPTELDGRSICYLRIRIKLENVMTMRCGVDFITRNDGAWDSSKSIGAWATERDFENCYLPAYACGSWQQEVTGLRVHPAQSCGRFSIEAIELISYEVMPTRIFANGGERGFQAEPVFDAGVMLASLEGIKDIVGVVTFWDYGNGKYTVANEETELVFTFGSRTVLANKKEEQLDAAPILRDRTAYVPLEYVCGKMGVKMSYNADKKELYFI